MFTQEKYESIQKELNRLTAQKIKVTRLVFYIYLLVLLLGLTIYLLSNQDDLLVILITGILIGLGILGLVFSKFLISKQTMSDYLYHEIIEHINLDSGMFYKYSGKEKNTKEQIDKFYEGGLFPRAAVFVINNMSGFNAEQLKFECFNLKIISSNGNTSTIHFDGIYYLMETHLTTDLQLRTKGKPNVKGEKYQLINENEYMSVYKPETENLNDVDENIIKKVKSYFTDETYKNVYLSVKNGHIHFALKYKHSLIDKINIKNIDQLNQLLVYINKSLELPNLFDE
ncbi:MAG: hypothetical protein WCR19_01090 [Acholeplasmataceae bacterium]